MTLRELLRSFNIIIAEYDSVQEFKVVNDNNFCTFDLLNYLRSEAFKDDLETCCHNIDKATQLGRNPSLYFSHEWKNGNIAITMKIRDSSSKA